MNRDRDMQLLHSVLQHFSWAYRRAYRAYQFWYPCKTDESSLREKQLILWKCRKQHPLQLLLAFRKAHLNIGRAY